MHVLRDHRQAAGMPQLAYAGLSENWLLKECGQRHWHGIAGACGQVLPRFHDVAGRTAYAAFTAISISNASLEDIGEHVRFGVASTVAPAGRSQYFSRHVLRGRGREHATVRMLSAFVVRNETGNNQSVTRAVLAPMESGTAGQGGHLVGEIDDLIECAARARRDRPGYPDLALVAPESALSFRFSPCPAGDFNGANFLYFAAFQDIVERAEWSWFRRFDLPRLTSREMYFYGNVNIGDDVQVRLMALGEAGGGLAYWCRVMRESDGARIADVVTRKRAAKCGMP